MPDLLLSSDARGVVTLTLNRPERHNAFDDAVVARLTSTFRQLAENEAVRILVIRGAGRSFSAGGDIEWMRRMAGASFEENLRDADALARWVDAMLTDPDRRAAMAEAGVAAATRFAELPQQVAALLTGLLR